MILSVLLKHFGIDIDMPEYLLNHPFNEVFLDGDVTVEDNVYTIAVRTRQDVTHQMFLKANDEFPVIVMSELPNGKLNGMKFPQEEHVGIPINKL
ncbi:MAG: hypothetical protein E7Z78_06835 [Methanobrevibacter thaueri]|jgi:hypothetical protein|uniref:hypothetical protein n=1 Tax=Methanobrevibacter thaueri TaxID=190975 RepID=UPI0026ECD6B3|nr:hypothetical protein [Methanobrevibacter thaueri]MBE6496146.1 hypothetical protein [Methanobrevibacter thaueri]